jgi:uncharacterized protein (TIGR02118 family)
MAKVIVLLARRPDMSVDEFRAHLQEKHSPLVLRLPGLKRLVVNLALPDPTGADPAYDAIAEDWFESFDAMNAAFASDAMKAIQEDSPNCFDMSKLALLVVEEQEVPV